MIASMCVTMLGYAIHRLWGFSKDGNGIKDFSASQREYMAEVKVRNLQAMEHEAKRARYEHARSKGWVS